MRAPRTARNTNAQPKVNSPGNRLGLMIDFRVVPLALLSERPLRSGPPARRRKWCALRLRYPDRSWQTEGTRLARLHFRIVCLEPERP